MQTSHCSLMREKGPGSLASLLCESRIPLTRPPPSRPSPLPTAAQVLRMRRPGWEERVCCSGPRPGSPGCVQQLRDGVRTLPRGPGACRECARRSTGVEGDPSSPGPPARARARHTCERVLLLTPPWGPGAEGASPCPWASRHCRREQLWWALPLPSPRVDTWAQPTSPVRLAEPCVLLPSLVSGHGILAPWSQPGAWGGGGGVGGLIMQIRLTFNCQRQQKRLDVRTLCGCSDAPELVFLPHIIERMGHSFK